MATSARKPKIGESVIYVPPKDDLECTLNFATKNAAIISQVFEQEEGQDTRLNLRVFPDGPKVPNRTGVLYDPEKKEHTWHWPED